MQGCTSDADCGDATSGRVCDLAGGRYCIDGCREPGHGCPSGQACDAPQGGLGQCVELATVDGGTLPPDAASPDPWDASDRGPVDGGVAEPSDAAANPTDASLADAGPAVPDAALSAADAAAIPQPDSGQPTAGVSGCSCQAGAGAGALAPLLCALPLLLGLRRRRG
ncbi:MAG: hypothetical protein QM765_45875 [Myxococcales bacterium]